MRALVSIAASEGVRVTLTETGRVKVAGPRNAVARVISGLRPVIETLRSHPCPADFPPERFERQRQGALQFAVEWAGEAVKAGWTHDELFALAEPFANLSRQGAAWFIGAATVTGVSAAAINIQTLSGETQRIYRRSLQ